MPDNGQPVFLAKVAAGPTQAGLPSGIGATNNMGVWAVDATGAIRLLVRTGDTLLVHGGPKTVSLLSLLSAVTGSPGQARSYNDAGDLVFRATFTDHTQAILRLRLP